MLYTQPLRLYLLQNRSYCRLNFLQSTIGPLQRVQNAAARVTLGLSPRDHGRPALKELHWLPVAHRVQYKVALLISRYTIAIPCI